MLVVIDIPIIAFSSDKNDKCVAKIICSVPPSQTLEKQLITIGIPDMQKRIALMIIGPYA